MKKEEQIRDLIKHLKSKLNYDLFKSTKHQTKGMIKALIWVLDEDEVKKK